jgi:hypothetical protein
MTKLCILVFVFFVGCNNHSNNGIELSSTKKDTSYSVLFNKVLPEKIDTTPISDKFRLFYKQLPDIKLPICLGKDKLPEIDFKKLGDLNNSIFSNDFGQPYGRIIKDNFIAILFSVPVQGEAEILATFSKDGKLIDHFTIHEFDGYDTIDTTYRNEEFSFTNIDSHLRIHIRHKSILIKNYKKDILIQDSIVRVNRIEDYRININGEFIRIIKK